MGCAALLAGCLRRPITRHVGTDRRGATCPRMGLWPQLADDRRPESCSNELDSSMTQEDAHGSIIQSAVLDDGLRLDLHVPAIC